MSEKVWWCNEHRCSISLKDRFTDACTLSSWLIEADSPGGDRPCVMVERLLVDPVSTLIVEKGEDGGLEARIRDAIEGNVAGLVSDRVVQDVLDALKVAYDSQGEKP